MYLYGCIVGVCNMHVCIQQIPGGPEMLVTVPPNTAGGDTIAVEIPTVLERRTYVHTLYNYIP